MIAYLKLIAIHLRLWRWLRNRDQFFHDVSDVSSVGDRTEFLLELARNRRVLHFGFADAPFTEERIGSGTLLHLKLREVATICFGLDVAQDAIETYRNLTGDRANAVLDIEDPLPNRDRWSEQFDLILFSETLEHLGNPLSALANLFTLCLTNPGSELCVTVPNAFAVSGFLAAMNGHEIVHPDHITYFSPVTLRNLLSRAGFEDIRVSLYGSSATRLAPGVTGSGLIGLCRVVG